MSFQSSTDLWNLQLVWSPQELFSDRPPESHPLLVQLKILLTNQEVSGAPILYRFLLSGILPSNFNCLLMSELQSLFPPSYETAVLYLVSIVLRCVLKGVPRKKPERMWSSPCLFLLFQGHSATLPIVQCLKTVVHIFCLNL